VQIMKVIRAFFVYTGTFLFFNLVVTATPSFLLQKVTLQKFIKRNSTVVHKASDILAAETVFRNFNRAIFISKDLRLAFRNYYNFKPLSRTEKAFLVERSVGEADAMEKYPKELQGMWGEFAWRYGYGELYFAFGLPSVDLTDENDNLAINYSIKKYDDCLSIALKDSVVSKEQFQTSLEILVSSKTASIAQLSANLRITEKVYRSLDRVILREIDNTIYARNIKAALRSISVGKVIFQGKVFFYCYMKPYFECYITRINGKFKIISLSDNN
jgi:hypothetical protein